MRRRRLLRGDFRKENDKIWACPSPPAACGGLRRGSASSGLGLSASVGAARGFARDGAELAASPPPCGRLTRRSSRASPALRSRWLGAVAHRRLWVEDQTVRPRRKPTGRSIRSVVGVCVGVGVGGSSGSGIADGDADADADDVATEAISVVAWPARRAPASAQSTRRRAPRSPGRSRCRCAGPRRSRR